MKRTTVLNLLCAGLMLALLVLQYTPFWDAGEETTSINGYVWFPTEHTATTSYLEETLGDDFSMNALVITPILQMVTAAAGVVLCVWKAQTCWTALLPAACGASGLIGYLATPALRLGSGWSLHLLVSLAMLLCALLCILLDRREQAA